MPRPLAAIIITLAIASILNCGGGSDNEIHVDPPAAFDVQIASPVPNATIAAGDQTQFEGSCSSFAGEKLNNVNLVWHSNTDGQIGTGETFQTETLSAGTHVIELSCTDSAGDVEGATVDITVYATTATGKVPDTGQIYSHTESHGADADYTINAPGYVKLDAEGNRLDMEVVDWVMVRDAVTGLIWEAKTDDGGINDKNNVYSWHDARAMVDQLNQEKFGGHEDWRLPTVKELTYLVHAHTTGPIMINSTYFPHSVSEYWSSTTDTDIESVNAWMTYFNSGLNEISQMTSEIGVRAVRGDNKTTSLTDNGNGTVTDLFTGLIWQKNDDAGEMTWEEALAYCENLKLAGYDDWRLPNRNELISIADHKVFDPAIDTKFFPGAVSLLYWSGTTQTGSDSAYGVEFFTGDMRSGFKEHVHQVRAVRGGNPKHLQQTASIVPQILSPARDASIPAGDQIRFEGSCSDRNGESANGASMAWQSDVDGQICTDATCDADNLSAGAHLITLTCSDTDGAEGKASVAIVVYATAATGLLPDTGQIVSYTEASGEDSDYALHQPGYVKLDAGARVLETNARDWVMARDAVTGLIWEVKTDDGGIHDKDNVYSWHEALTIIDRLNQEEFGGYDDWRLPTVKELSCLVQMDTIPPMINRDFFPFNNNLAASLHYWSATTVEEINSVNGWYTNFMEGRFGIAQMSSELGVRAVRGDTKAIELVDNGDGTVTDKTTGLMWQKNGESGEMTWEEALTYCENLNLAEYDDWRLPNRNELLSIIDHGTTDPAIDQNYFPEAQSWFHWSATTRKNHKSAAYSVNFFSGYMDSNPKQNEQHVRAVRGGK